MFDYSGNSNAIWRGRAQVPAADRVSAMLMKIIDCCLAGVVFVVPFLFGGRHAIGQLMLVVLAVVMTLAWALHQIIRPRAAWRPTWALALIFAGALLIFMQIVPLPQPLLERLAPQQADILPLWNAEQATNGSMGRWPYVSYTPADTGMGLALFAAYGMLFFVTVQRLGEIEDMERLLKWCAISVLCMALFGLVQYLAGNGKFFWLMRYPFTYTLDGVKGSFTNRNHFAQFLALGIGPLIWWLQHESRRNRSHTRGAMQPWAHGVGSGELKTYLLGLALAIVLFAGLMSLSRGGMAAMLLAATVASAACWRATSGAGRFLATLIAAVVVIGAALSIFGLDHIGRRLDSMNPYATEEKDWTGGRREIWTTAAKAITDHVVFGAGVGSFREVYPMYGQNAEAEQIVITHAENSYLQVLLETGVIGLGLLLAGAGLFGSWCAAGWKGPVRMKVCAGAIAAALAASLAQALVDFVWYVPACMAVMAILAACAMRVGQFASNSPAAVLVAPMRRWAARCAATALLPIGVWMVHSSIGPAIAAPYWDQYLLAQEGVQTEPRKSVNTDHTAQGNAADRAVEREQKLINYLEHVVYWQPTHASAHLALAQSHLKLFEQFQVSAPNQMTLVNIRDAALESQFASRESLCAWLSRAFGDHWVHLDAALQHARQAISLCPLQGRGYIYMAQLCFLDKTGCPLKQVCVEQALRVRPFDGAVVYVAAAEALLSGDWTGWLELSKHAFRCGRSYQRNLIGDLVDHTPQENTQEMIEFIITRFQLDLEGLQILYEACAKRCSAEQLAGLRRYQAQMTEAQARARKDSDAARLWLAAQRLHTQLQDHSRALECARCALQCDPNSYQVHFQLALCLLNERQFADSEMHLHWCMQRNPNDKSLENRLKEALKGRLDAQRSASAVKETKL